MRKELFLFFCFFSLSARTFSQDTQVRYQMGKNFLQQGKYGAAMESFKPLLSPIEGNNYIEYAHYFYALAALKAKKLKDSRQIIKQLLLKYPDWNKKNEAFYLLANIYFEEQNFEDALTEIEHFKKGMIQQNATQMERFYLKKIQSIDSLEALQKQFPQDKELAQILASRLSKSPRSEKQEILLNYLVEEFQLDPSKLENWRIETEKKKAYNVAVLFPFMVGKLNTENVSRPNQFLLDMYEGLKLAADSLSREQGIKINLYAYDTEKEPEKFTKLLNESSIQQADMIIGPVYNSHLPIAAAFAKKYQIQLISPFSHDTSLIEANPLVYLFLPTFQNEVCEVTHYIRNKNKPSIIFPEQEESLLSTQKPKPVAVNKAIIFYGTSEKDSLMAYAYKEALLSQTDEVFEADTNFEIGIFEKVTRENINRIKSVLTDSALMMQVNNIFVVTEDQVVAATVISSTEITGMDIPIFTTSEWLDFNLITVEQFERRKVHFMYPDYLDYDKVSVRNFKQKHLDSTHLYPTTFAFQGYDMLMFFGTMLQQFGTFFGNGLQETDFINGFTLAGYDYHDSQSNRFCPLVIFTNGKLEIVNTPLSLEKK